MESETKTPPELPAPKAALVLRGGCGYLIGWTDGKVRCPYPGQVCPGPHTIEVH